MNFQVTAWLLLAALLWPAEQVMKGEAMAAAASDWEDLPALPEALAGQCVGMSGDWLLVAGGSLWSAPPWNGGVKTWSDRVYGLRAGSSAWRLLGRLPVAMAYGASAQRGDALVCAGGQNASTAFRTVRSLRVNSRGQLRVEELPPLPGPLTNAAAAIVGGTLYVIGGQTTLNPQCTAKHASRLNLTKRQGWEVLKTPWEHTRILPAVAGCGASVFVGGGADLSAGQNGAPVRTYLRDAWRFDTNNDTWQRLPDLSASVTAAPSACSAQGDWLIFGGDDGALASQIQTLRDEHPGFRKQVLRFRVREQQWSLDGELPLSLVTTGVVSWHGHYFIPGGENQPGHRSARVIESKLDRRKRH